MFERRLKIFLLVLVLATIVLLLRAVQLQVVEHSYWTQRAAGLLQNTQTTATTRGRILDINGKVMAEDVPCTDACVDYRAIINPPDPKWVARVVRDRLLSQMGSAYRKLPSAKRAAMKDAETRQVLTDINSMWKTLAELYQPTDDQEIGEDPRVAVEDIRRSIVQRVEMRRRWVWFHNYQRGQAKIEHLPEWRKWLAGDAGDGPDIDSFDVTVDEQTQPHVILPAIDAQTSNFLGKRLSQFPGLVLQPSKHRLYPMKTVACHILGRIARVSAEDLEKARSLNLDETRMYLPNDQIGRDGIEALCEPLLRGARGMIERRVGDGAIIEQKNFVPGQDVRLSIDADLQAQVQQMLKHVRQKKANGEWATPPPGMDMHGAAVVIDVKTGEIRAMASNPDFDVNELNDHYAVLVQDRLNNPLVDRATCDEFEPGSTVKPLVGLGAITQGVLKPLEGIECTGYLVLDVNGRKVRERTGRCWIASEWGDWLRTHGMSVAHHPIPYPHKGHDGNPDGWLTYSDALERSCNVFFETVADRLGPQGMAHWYDAFGFGRLTGIGITERRGLRPGQRPVDPAMARMANCITGIGQGQVWATPLQVANEAATIARGGIWMRPHLLTANTQARLDAVSPRPPDMPPDAVNLHLSPEGLIQAKIGMIAVVNGKSGTGTAPQRDDMLVAGKTGTAQAARIWQRLTDQNGNVIREPLPPANDAHPDTSTPWYRSTDDEGKDVVHAWFMGFAPASKPEIAFCVLIEYGGAGGGGGIAGPVVSNILEACVQHGYLHPPQHLMPIALAQ